MPWFQELNSITKNTKKMIVRLIVFLGTLLLFNGCASNPDIDVTKNLLVGKLYTAYDYQLLNQAYQPISLAELVGSLKDSDVVFIGEYHRNHASHLLEMQVFVALHQLDKKSNRQIILSMEMFTRDQQAILDDYIDGVIGERYLIEEAPSWKNYQGSYRPLVEYAKQNSIPVIAANASGDIVRCIGHKGGDYIDKLNAEEKGYIAEQPFTEIPGYEDKFYGFMASSQNMPNHHQRQSYLAQLTRDNTMAESIANVLKQLPNSQVVHLNGSFHSEDYLGTVGALKRMNPKLKIKVITPIHLTKFTAPLQAKQPNKRKDDFYYLLNPQPQEFVDSDYKKKILKEMFDEAKEKTKSCK